MLYYPQYDYEPLRKVRREYSACCQLMKEDFAATENNFSTEANRQRFRNRESVTLLTRKLLETQKEAEEVYIAGMKGKYDKLLTDVLFMLNSYNRDDFLSALKFKKDITARFDSCPEEDKKAWSEGVIKRIEFGRKLSEYTLDNAVYFLAAYLGLQIEIIKKYNFSHNAVIEAFKSKLQTLYPEATPEELATVDIFVTYKTRARAEDALDISGVKYTIPTLPGYSDSLSFRDNDIACLLPPLIDKEGSVITYNKGISYNSEQDITFIGEKTLKKTTFKDRKTGEIANIDTSFLYLFYSIILEDFQSSSEIRNKYEIFVNDLATMQGKDVRYSQEEIKELAAKLQEISNIWGFIKTPRGESIFPVLTFLGYDSVKNTFSFSSPYLNHYIKEEYSARIKKDKKDQPLLRKDGSPQLLPAHSYLIKASITKSRVSPAVIDGVRIIVTLIEQAGSVPVKDESGKTLGEKGNPHIALKEYIERNVQFKEQLNNTPQNHKSRVFSRHFKSLWELLSTETYLEAAYKEIQLPRPYNDGKDGRKNDIPKLSEIKTKVLSFPHKGKAKNCAELG